MSKKAKRADGRYQVQATIGHDEKGNRIRKYFYGETQREAQEKRKKYLEGLAIDSDASKMTVRTWANLWLDSYSRGGYRNKENNKSIVNTFLTFLGAKSNRPICEIKPIDIQSFARERSSLSESHVKKTRYVLGQIFKAAIDNGYMSTSPCDGVVWDYIKAGSRDAVSTDTIDAIRSHWNEHTAGTWAMLVLYAGLRPSEAFALKRENITDDEIVVTDGSHFEHGKLVVMPNQTKSEAGQRRIPITPALRPVIDSMPKSGFVCTSTKGMPVSQSAYKRNWVTFKNIAGIDCDLYSLRHTFCSMIYDLGVDVKTAQYLMGHADLEVTMKIYTHLSEKKKRLSLSL